MKSSFALLAFLFLLTPQFAGIAAAEACNPEVQVINLSVEVSDCTRDGAGYCELNFSTATAEFVSPSVVCPVEESFLNAQDFFVLLSNKPRALDGPAHNFTGVLVLDGANPNSVLEFDGELSPAE